MYATDGLEFLEYAWRRRAMIAAACTTALAIAGAVSAFLTPRYTATASVLIESPSGNDPRAATAVSTVYLESLKTYELIASSDSIFARALDDLHLRNKYPNASVESLKQRILTLNKPTNTSILEISATLNDPRQAQALAQYIAEHAVALNAQLDDQSNQDVLLEPERLFDQAVSRRASAEKAREEFAKTSSVETMEEEAAAVRDLQKEVELDLARAKTELAEDLARQQAPQPADTPETQVAWTRLEIAAERARIQELEAQAKQLSDSVSRKELGLEALIHTRDSLDAELRSARAGEEAAQTKLGDVRASSAFRGIRLKVLDPGIVPQRASSPNTPLNLAVAFVFSLLASITFLAVRFGYSRIRRANADPVYSLR
jgi:capsular polysaccharide biosynthesis protein